MRVGLAEVAWQRRLALQFGGDSLAVALAGVGADPLQTGGTVAIEGGAAVVLVAEVEQRGDVVRRAGIEMRYTLQRPQGLRRHRGEREGAGRLLQGQRLRHAEVDADQRVQQLRQAFRIPGRHGRAQAGVAPPLVRAHTGREARLAGRFDQGLRLFEKVVDEDHRMFADLRSADIRRHPHRELTALHGCQTFQYQPRRSSQWTMAAQTATKATAKASDCPCGPSHGPKGPNCVRYSGPIQPKPSSSTVHIQAPA
mmetsp:Transcript_22294/g.87873  ORF Transcript_22294/g.87873 Transcript_22294/m.87873 type:complete len:254 (-) Transcript_22294:2724-3485(-)